MLKRSLIVTLIGRSAMRGRVDAPRKGVGCANSEVESPTWRAPAQEVSEDFQQTTARGNVV